jgi:hypothetical protein
VGGGERADDPVPWGGAAAEILAVASYLGPRPRDGCSGRSWARCTAACEPTCPVSGFPGPCGGLLVRVREGDSRVKRFFPYRLKFSDYDPPHSGCPLPPEMRHYEAGGFVTNPSARTTIESGDFVERLLSMEVFAIAAPID